MEKTKCSEVIEILSEASDYFYIQEKLYIFKDGKTHIIHNVNQKSYEYIMSKTNKEISTFPPLNRKKVVNFGVKKKKKF